MSRRPGWATERIGRLLAEGADHARLVRGTELADLRRVHDIDLRPGQVTATVVGSRGDAYEVEARLPADQGPPTDLDDLRTRCTCPDWGDPCKHAVALLLTVAERLDVEPELAEVLWGRASAPPPPPATAGPSHGPRPASTRSHLPVRPLPRHPPAWAEGLPPTMPPRSTDALFGTPRVGRAPAQPGPGAGSGPDPAAVLDALGPLEVGGLDLAPSLRELASHLGP